MPTWKTLDEKTGGLSAPGKMPCLSWSISALRCKIGSLLRMIKESVCFKCYALKGRYVFPNTIKAQERRYAAWKKDRKGWVEAMAASILKTKDDYFRWFDSGDIQGEAMLTDIVRVAELTPDVKQWLPTREWPIVRDYIEAGHSFPPNLNVRLSAPLVDQARNEWTHTTSSRVHSGELWESWKIEGVFGCPAYTNQGKCPDDCRACWNPEVAVVSYPIH